MSELNSLVSKSKKDLPERSIFDVLKAANIKIEPKEHHQDREHRHLFEKEKQAHQQKLEWFAWRIIFASISGFGVLCLLISMFSANPDATKGALGLLASIVSGFFGYLAGRGSK